MREMVHLWEADHAYYCNSANWYNPSEDCFKFDSCESFLAAYKDADLDYNLLFRWDWKTDEETGEQTLWTFWMEQRRGRFVSCRCPVTHEDEQKIVEFLRPRFVQLMGLWSPIVRWAADLGGERMDSVAIPG